MLILELEKFNCPGQRFLGHNNVRSPGGSLGLVYRTQRRLKAGTSRFLGQDERWRFPDSSSKAYNQGVLLRLHELGRCWLNLRLFVTLCHTCSVWWCGCMYSVSLPGHVLDVCLSLQHLLLRSCFTQRTGLVL